MPKPILTRPGKVSGKVPLEERTFWSARAEEAHSMAGTVTGPESRQSLLRTAKTYGKLAKHAMARGSGAQPRPESTTRLKSEPGVWESPAEGPVQPKPFDVGEY